MLCKRYIVYDCIICVFLIVTFVQGVLIPVPNFPSNTGDETTGHIDERNIFLPRPVVPNRTKHEENTTPKATDKDTVTEEVQTTMPTDKDIITEEIQYTMHTLCPYGKFCPNAPPNVSSDEDGRPCCTGCSCSENCSEEGNGVCCFPNTGQPENVTIKRMECLTATFNQISLPKTVLLPRYNMVTDCPLTYLEPSEENKVMVQSCKDDTLIQSLRPVFSKATKLIYKNKFCAQCHGETSFIFWTPYLICTGELIQVEISNNFLSPNCYIRFKYPGDMLDIQFHKCCLPTFSNLPRELSLDRDTVIRLCEHGIYAPFSYKNGDLEEVFVNIYCAICSSNFYDVKLSTCTNANIEDPTKKTFLGILDISFFDDKRSDNVVDTKKAKMEACRTLDSGEQTCRKLFCKTGQVLNQAGQCVFVSLHWHLEDVHLILKLSHSADYPDCTFYDLLESKDLGPHLKSGWPATGTVHYLYTGTSLCNRTRRLVTKCDPYIVVVYSIKYYKQNNQSFPEFLISVRKLLSEPWFLDINGSSFRLTSEFLNLNSLTDNALWSLRNDVNYVLPYIAIPVPVSSFEITILFFCEQISLHEFEYEIFTIRYGEGKYTIIYTPEQGKIFLPNEYTLHTREDGSVIPTVCVTDTSFQKALQSNAGRQVYGIYVFIPVIIVLPSLVFTAFGW